MNIKRSIITWIKAARAPFFVASIIPASLGGAIAYSHGSFDFALFLIVVLGLVLAQAGADFLDDYFDFKSGNVANKSKQFTESPLLKGDIKLEHVLYAGLLCIAIFAVIAIYLTIKLGYPVLVLACIGGFICCFYTAPPFKLGYRGLGEILIFLAFGPLLVTGVYYVMTKEVAIEPVIASLPLGILIANITYVGAIFDYETDKSARKKCIVVMLGKSKAVKFLSILFLIAYSVVVFSVVFRIMPFWTLLSLTTIPIAVSAIKISSRYSQPSGYTPAVARTVATSSITGILICIGYLISV